jgi:hypothetical protein
MRDTAEELPALRDGRTMIVVGGVDDVRLAVARAADQRPTEGSISAIAGA